MFALPRRQSLSVLLLVLAIVGAALWIGRPVSEAASPAAQSAPPTGPIPGAGNVAFALSPSLTLPISSFQFGAGRSVSQDGEASNLSLSEVTLSLASSAVDPRLLQAVDTGDSISTVTITSSDPNQGRRQWILTDVIPSGASWSRGAKAGEMSLSLNYGTITLTTFNRTGQVIGSHCAVNRLNSDCNVT